MSEQNLTASVDATEVVSTESNGEIQRVFDTLEECKANRPEEMKSEKCKVFEVTRPNGTVAFAWGFTGQAAMYYVAHSDEYKVRAAESKRGGPRKPTVEDTKKVFMEFGEEEMRKMGLPDNMITAILAARQGSTNAADHLKDKEPDMPAVQPTKGKGRNKGK